MGDVNTKLSTNSKNFNSTPPQKDAEIVFLSTISKFLCELEIRPRH